MTAPASTHAPVTAPSASAPTSDAAEVGKFDALAHRFWDTRGEFKPLHMLNPVRVKFVADRAALSGARVLDVGCGGGLLCEALSHAGAKVTGIDLAEGMVEVARLHAAEQNLPIEYRLADAESLVAAHAGQFDVVTCMEMLEHVPHPDATVATLAKLVKPAGRCYLHRQSESQVVPAGDRRRGIRDEAHSARHA
jgi:2-polyprenyl-6-hydroxyphenyl methylase/3-demethylubiquinone-9 3-methyltransferase